MSLTDLQQRSWDNVEITEVVLPDGTNFAPNRACAIGGYCTGIRAFAEPGEMSLVLWLEIDLDFVDGIRMPARQAQYIRVKERVRTSP